MQEGQDKQARVIWGYMGCRVENCIFCVQGRKLYILCAGSKTVYFVCRVENCINCVLSLDKLQRSCMLSGWIKRPGLFGEATSVVPGLVFSAVAALAPELCDCFVGMIRELGVVLGWADKVTG